MQVGDWFFWCTTFFVVWSVQQSWRFAARYAVLVHQGALVDKALLFRAWTQRGRAGRCSFFLWWGLSLCALWLVYFGLPPAAAPLGWKHLLQWGCLLVLPMFFIALARIDQQVLLLPDALLIPLAWVGAAYNFGTGKLPFFTTAGLFLIVLLVFYCFNTWIEKHPSHVLIRWLGAGDLKFLLVAFYWLSAWQIMLMWGCAAVFCWTHQCWRQKNILPRGYAALGPYLVLGWVFAQWVHPALL